MAAKLSTTVTFKESERHLYDFLKSRRSQSAFIKDLIEAYLNNQPLVNVSPVYHQQQVIQPETINSIPEEKKEEKTETKMNAKKRSVLVAINDDFWDNEED